MANVKDLKKKIKSTKSTLKITTAMKLVSAAKLGRAQQAIDNARPYARELEDTIRVVSALAQNYTHPFLQENKKKKNNHSLLLVITANKGLCGGYNSQLVKDVRRYLLEEKDKDKEEAQDYKVCFIGKKGRELLKDEVNDGGIFTFKSLEPQFDEVKKIAETLSGEYEKGEVGSIYVAYNDFRSAMNFVPTVKKVLPMTLDETIKKKLRNEHPFDFKYEPNAADILDTLVPETYVSTVYACILNALAAEHGSRMTAMDSATKNCKEVIRALTLKMNKLRQASITTELIEVISGAESLNA